MGSSAHRDRIDSQMSTAIATSDTTAKNESVSLDRQEVLDMIDQEARLLGMSGHDAIDRVKSGKPGSGSYVWDDISLLVSLLSE